MNGHLARYIGILFGAKKVDTGTDGYNPFKSLEQIVSGK
jgi:hypothetical protein